MDLILFIVEPGQKEEDQDIAIKELTQQRKPIVLALNKIDRIKKTDLLPWMDDYHRRLNPAALVPISAKTGENVPDLLREITERLPVGPQYYDPETLTDQPERFIAAEMIREQVFRLTGQEIPYSTAVTTESFSEDERLIRIEATIHVERNSQKKIVYRSEWFQAQADR